MQRKPYTRYSREFKLEAVRQAALGEKPKAQIARALGIRVGHLRDWRLQFEEDSRTAGLQVADLIDASGTPIIDAFSGNPFHVTLARREGSFEFTHAEIGSGTAKVTGLVAMELVATYAHFCVHHYDQEGLSRAAQEARRHTAARIDLETDVHGAPQSAVLIDHPVAVK